MSRWLPVFGRTCCIIFTLKLNAPGTFETLVTMYKTTCYHNLEDHNLYFKLVTCFGSCWISDFIGLSANILKTLAFHSQPHSQLTPQSTPCLLGPHFCPLTIYKLFVLWSGCSSKHLLICSLTDYFKWLCSDANSALLILAFQLMHSRI